MGTGDGQSVQLYKGILWGLFLFDKKIKHDEEGHKWVHLLYRSGHGWGARVDLGGMVDAHNHFDCLELGADFEAGFDATIALFRCGGGGDGDMMSPSPSPVPGKKKSADMAWKPPRTSTEKSHHSDGRGPQARSKRKRAATSDRGSKQKKGPSGKSKGKPGGGGAAGSMADANYDSDGSIGGGETDWNDLRRAGALPSLTKSQQVLRRKLSEIPEPDYKAAFKRTSIMKVKGEKVCPVMCHAFL